MKCPQCGIEAPETARFCFNCGSELMVVCPQCRAALPSQARFCSECGAKIGASPPQPAVEAEAGVAQALQRLVPKEFAERLRASRGQVGHERRLVTILFSDVKGSTAMAEELDPEEVMEIMNGAFELLIGPVFRHEGTLARLMGDAILAFFGAPIAHEDDTERAIRAALEIIAGAQGYAERLERERGIRGFNVRVGINTGLVVVGEVGSDLRVEYTAMGDAVNLAARMEQNAPPGGILISHDTYRHIQGMFDVEPQAPLMVKGKAEPVQTYLVQRAKPQAWRVARRGVAGVQTRMVAREAELLALQNIYRDVAEGAETRLVAIVGEAGVGKSRLLNEFSTWLDMLPDRVWYFKGRAAIATQTMPYSLVRDLFAYRFDILESDSAATALSKFRAGMTALLESDKADLVGHLVGFDFSSSPAVRALLGSLSFQQQAKAYLVQYLCGLLGQAPMVVFLEDLHWADDSSLDLVDYLAAAIPAAPLLIVGTARHLFLERRPSWGEGQEAYTRLELRALSRRATRALVGEILQRAVDVPEAIRDLVVDGAEGNPYYVEELIKMLIEDGVIVPGEVAWTVALDRLADVRVPPTLTEILQARLDALPGAEKAVLQRAAVVGRDFWDRLVGELAADVTAGPEVGRALAALRGRELIFRRERSVFAGTDEYTFKHSMLRDVTYETVLLKVRRRYHAQVAQWLEAHAGERLGEYLSLIAGHYELAGMGAEAAEYLRRSAIESHEVSAYRDAALALERALRLWPEERRGERAETLVRLGRVRMLLGDFVGARADLEAGLALARETGERRTEGTALASLGEVGWRQGSLESAESDLQTGLSVAQECGDLTGEALIRRNLARHSWLRGQYEQAIGWAEGSRALYEQLGDRRGLVAALNELGIVALMQREYDLARGYFADNLAQARQRNDRYGMAQALNNLGEVASAQGAYDEARGYYEQARAISEEIGERRGVATHYGNLSYVCFVQGQVDAAWEYVRKALKECMAIEAISHALGTLVPVSQLLLHAGEVERAAELLGLALHHPASTSEIQRGAESMLEELRATLGTSELEAALARGAKLDLYQVVGEILAS